MAAKNTFTWTSRQARNVMNSPAVQRKVKAAADKAAARFRSVAPRRSGDFRKNVRVEKAKGWDGRDGYRVVAFANAGNSPIPIEFGTKDTRPANTLQKAIGAASGRR